MAKFIRKFINKRGKQQLVTKGSNNHYIYNQCAIKKIYQSMNASRSRDQQKSSVILMTTSLMST